MTLLQAAASVVLWNTKRFDTHDIAGLLHVAEADIERVLFEVREHNRLMLVPNDMTAVDAARADEQRPC